MYDDLVMHCNANYNSAWVRAGDFKHLINPVNKLKMNKGKYMILICNLEYLKTAYSRSREDNWWPFKTFFLSKTIARLLEYREPDRISALAL